MKDLELIARIEKNGTCPVLWYGNEYGDIYRVDFEKLPLVDPKNWSYDMVEDMLGLNPEKSEVWIHPDYKEDITEEIEGQIKAKDMDITSLEYQMKKYQRLQRRLSDKKKWHIIVKQEEWDKFKPYLIDKEIKFHSCGHFEDVYVEYEITEEEKQAIEAFLEEMRGENNGKDNGSQSK